MQKIMEVIECVLAFLRKIPLSNSSIKQYKIYLRSSIIPYCEANCIESFSDDEMQAYAEEQMSKAGSIPAQRTRKQLIKSIGLLIN